MRRILNLIKADAKFILRDGILLIALLAPILLAFVIRFGVPIVTDLVMAEFGFDVVPLYPLFIGFSIFITAMMIGVLIGFIILDERDEDILAYLAVTPLSKSYYLGYRLSSPFVICFVLGALVVVIADLVTAPIWLWVVVLLLAALEAPMCTLFLVAFASNKVEGLALSKLLGVLYVAPIVGVMVESPLRFVLAVIPQFWLVWPLYISVSWHVWLVLLGGIAIHCMVLRGLYQRFSLKITF